MSGMKNQVKSDLNLANKVVINFSKFKKQTTTHSTNILDCSWQDDDVIKICFPNNPNVALSLTPSLYPVM